MVLSDSSRLYIVELCSYGALLPVITYLGWRHKLPGLLGYFYLSVFCVVRIVADVSVPVPSWLGPLHD
jgi:hypothetical protein